MAGLEGDVKVPLVGTVPKKVAAGAAAGLGVLVVIYYVRKNKAASGAAATAAAGAAATATDQYPPDGTTGNPQDPYSVDPATGQTYGDENSGSGGSYGAYGDGSSADSGTYPWDGTTGDAADPYSLDPETGETYGNQGQTGGVTGANGPPFPNNSAWENWTVQQLQTNDPGISQSDLTAALGLYLNGQPVSAAQKSLIFDATGVGGDPPIAGPSNYPPNVRTNGDTGPGDATVTVPNVVGQSQEAAEAILSAAGLKSKGSPVVKGKTLTVDKQSPEAGKKVAKGSTVTLTSSDKGGTAAAKVKVPNVVGMEQSKAFAAISAAGLKPSGPAAVKGKVHTVTGQDPKAGAEAGKGSTVKLTSKTS